jgi:hypothetical protein
MGNITDYGFLKLSVLIGYAKEEQPSSISTHGTPARSVHRIHLLIC